MRTVRSRWREARTRERLVVAAILAAGWTLAAVSYATAPAAAVDDEAQGEIDDMEHSKGYLLQVERVGGKAAVLTTELDSWLASLWDGRRRAYTIAALTAACAGVYVALRRAAARAEEPPPPAE